jgi:hypothetical protein
MKRLSFLLIPIFLALLLCSCTQDITDPKTLHAKTWPALFEEFWTVMNEDYVHFAYETETTDWDAVYENYSEKFKTLDYNKVEDTFTAFRYFKEIIVTLSDYHYHLILEDNFGYNLDARPSALQKWLAAGQTDIMDFPDITKTENKVKNYYTVNGGPNKTFTREEILAKWNIAISGYTEVSDLQKAGTFHNPTGTVSDTFYTSTYGEVTKIAKIENNLYWDNFIVDAFGLEGTSWCTGVTKSGVLYIYFSQFVDKDLIKLCNYLAKESTMTDEEKKEAKKELPSTVNSAITVYKMLDNEQKAQLSVIINIFKYLNQAVENNAITLEDDTSVPINGIVIDLRDNGGGYAAFFDLFMSTFFASNKTIGYCRYKMGFSRYDYTPWTTFTLTNYNKALTEDYQGRLAIITNGFSVSCSELTTISSKLLPNSKTFGSTTYGATCPLYSRDDYQSGTYENDNLTVRTTTFRFKAYDGTSYEGYGIEPDISIPLSITEDNRFTAAVNWVANGVKSY